MPTCCRMPSSAWSYMSVSAASMAAQGPLSRQRVRPRFRSARNPTRAHVFRPPGWPLPLPGGFQPPVASQNQGTPRVQAPMSHSPYAPWPPCPRPPPPLALPGSAPLGGGGAAVPAPSLQGAPRPRCRRSAAGPEAEMTGAGPVMAGGSGSGCPGPALRDRPSQLPRSCLQSLAWCHPAHCHPSARSSPVASRVYQSRVREV